MNDHQRAMARKAGRPCGYVDGGLIDRVGETISRALGRPPKDETPEEKTRRIEDNVKRTMESAKEAEAAAMRRRGRVYPDGKPYAHGGKVSKVMDEFEAGTLRSGSKHGPRVTSRDQALAIGLSEARKAGEPVKPR